jgi:hypothetical protein
LAVDSVGPSSLFFLFTADFYWALIQQHTMLSWFIWNVGWFADFLMSGLSLLKWSILNIG